jgi:predicted transposase YdaD
MGAMALHQQDNLAAAFFRIEEARSPEELLSLARPLAQMLPEDDEPELRRAFTDLLVETLRTAFPEVTIPYVENLEELSMLEENMTRWRKSVLREGRKEGLKRGLERGRAQGHEEGRVAGIQRILLQQMKLRFGPLPLSVRRQIREITSMAELEALAGRLLTAASLSDLGLEI